MATLICKRAQMPCKRRRRAHTNRYNHNLPHSVPQLLPDRKGTYGKIVCEYKPHKFETHRPRLTVGRDKIDYLYLVAPPTSDITTFKCLINSVLSTDKEKFMTVDIRDFYLNTPMDQYEYMKLHIDVIPE